MRKRIELILVVILLGCSIGFAGAEAVPKSAQERYLGIWVADSLAVEIWQENSVWQCRAVFTDGDNESKIWEYSTCVYDEAEDALQCFGVSRTRERFDSLLDAIDELDWSMEDMIFSELRLSEEGLLFSGDELDAPVALTRLNDAEVTERNHALAFVGHWTSGSAALRVEDHGACYRFTVTVPVDDVTCCRWTTTCLYDPDNRRMASVNVSPRTVITREADGGATEVEEDFIASEAEFILEDGNRLVWKDMAGGDPVAFMRLAE